MKKGLSLIIFILLFSRPLSAGWIDDWIEQKTTSGVDHFETQKRGFGTLGGFSARWSQSNDYLMNATLPKFTAGCGGIDLFLGSYNFLQPEYLVQKLQGMINAAPAVAFDIALSTVSQQLGNSLGKYEAIIDRLNQLQLDDCKATQVILSEAAGNLFDNRAVQQYKSNAYSEFMQSSGISSLSYEWGQIGKTSGTSDAAAASQGVSGSQMIAACPPEMIAVFFTTGSMLENLLSSRGITASYAELLRGYIGDVYIDGTNINYTYVPPCDENSPDHIDGLINGEVYARPLAAGVFPPAACAPVTSIVAGASTYPNVEIWIFTILQNIADHIIAKTLLGTEETDFIEMLPISLYQSILTDIAARGQNVNTADIAAVYTDAAASAYAYAIMVDLYGTIDKAIQTGTVIIGNSQGAAAGADQNQCQMILAKPAKKHLKQMHESLPVYLDAARSQYLAKITEVMSYMEFHARNREARQVIRHAISRAFPGMRVGNGGM